MVARERVYRCLPMESRHVGCREAVDLGSLAHEQLDHIIVTSNRCRMQRRASFDTVRHVASLIDIRMTFDEPHRCISVVLLGGIEQCSIERLLLRANSARTAGAAAAAAAAARAPATAFSAAGGTTTAVAQATAVTATTRRQRSIERRQAQVIRSRV